jgi:hypothetical protein
MRARIGQRKTHFHQKKVGSECYWSLVSSDKFIPYSVIMWDKFAKNPDFISNL